MDQYYHGNQFNENNSGHRHKVSPSPWKLHKYRFPIMSGSGVGYCCHDNHSHDNNSQQVIRHIKQKPPRYSYRTAVMWASA